MKKSRIIVFTFILLLCLILTGCSSSDSGEGENNENTSQVTIDVFAHQSSDINLQTNKFTKAMEKKFDVQLNWTTVPFDGAAEKRQISLASGDYPDLYMLIPWVDRFSQTDLLKFGQQGVIIPLNKLIEQYAPNIKKVLDTNEYYRAMNTAPDGNIYGLTGLNECFHCSYPNKMWINTKWLEQLDLKEPGTTEEFKQMLEAFKTQDPNGNGKADEVPLSGSVENFGVRIVPFLMNGFIYNDDRTYLIVKDGQVGISADKPEWREGLTYIHSLYNEGLIDPGAFTQNAGTFKQIGDNADPQLLGAGAAMHPAIFVNTAEDSPYGKDYKAIPPLKGPHTEYASYNYPIDPGATFVLTNKASESAQIKAIQLLDYLYTQEGAMAGFLGEEGSSWRKPQEGEVALNEQVEPLYKTIPLPSGAERRNDSWGSLSQYNHHRAYRDAEVQGTNIFASDGYERRLYEATLPMEGKEPQEIFPHWALWVDPSTADEASMMQTNIKDYIDQNALQFITGAKSLEKDWDDYVRGLEGLNIKRYLEIMQASYDSSSVSK